MMIRIDMGAHRRAAAKRKSGMRITTYHFDHGSVECEIDYQAECRGTFLEGRQQEPDTPATLTISTAKAGGVDILDLLSPDVVSRIEQQAWEELKDGDPAYWEGPND